MTYALYNIGKGGTVRKIVGNPRSPKNQKKLVVWDKTKKGVLGWIKEFGTKTQKAKHLK